MAKALFGHISTPDTRSTSQLLAENRSLRQQVADLRALVGRLQEENDALAAALDPATLLTEQPAAADMQPA